MNMHWRLLLEPVYVEGLVKEYANFLNDDKKPASEKFWELEKRIKEECAVRFTVKGKTEAADISGEVEAAVSHRIPVIGLYPAMENTVVLELLDKSGKVTDSREITITTDELPDKLDDAVKPVKTSGESAFELTMVYGQRTTFPFAYDCMGDIRWYMSGEFTSGIYMLSNSRMIVVVYMIIIGDAFLKCCLLVLIF